MMIEICKTCIFWRIHPGYDDRGQCHRNAPVAIRSIPFEQSPFGLAFWPMTHPDSWCGQFKGMREFLTENENVWSIPFPVRIRRCFHKLKITTLKQLSEMTPNQLLAQKGIGATSVCQIQEELQKRGLSLSGESEQ